MAPTLSRSAARKRRWEMVANTFPTFSDMRVLGLGGEVDAWLKSPVRPRHVVLLNLAESVANDARRLRAVGDPHWLELRTGDACSAAESFGDERFDLVYSNSVIEHVGGRDHRLEFAASVNALADHHWIQTPYQYFPIEPHTYGPGFQFLPIRLRGGRYPHLAARECASSRHHARPANPGRDRHRDDRADRVPVVLSGFTYRTRARPRAHEITHRSPVTGERR